MKKIDMALYSEIGKILKRERTRQEISFDELVELINGVRTKSTLKRYEDGKSRIDMDTLYTICNGLNISYDDVIKEADSYVKYYESNDEEYIENLYKISTKRIPLLGTVACGKPIYADEHFESYVMVGAEINADFCLICKGDSMINARIQDGDIVFVRKQEIVKNGEIAVVIIDDEATLKRFYYYKEKEMVILKAENTKYEDIIYIGEQLNQVKVLGKAIAFQSDVI